MTPFTLLPDTLEIVVSWLKTDPLVTASVPANKIGVRPPGTASWPRITCDLRSETFPVEYRRVEGLIDVHIWGDPGSWTRHQTRTVAEQVRHSLQQMTGWHTAEWTVTNVRTLSSRWLPDDSREPTIPRQTVTIEVSAHP